MAETDIIKTSKGSQAGTSKGVDSTGNIVVTEDEYAGKSSIMHEQKHEIQMNGEEKDQEVAGSVEMGTSRSVDLGTSRSAEIVPQEVSIREPLEVPKQVPLKNYNNINNTYWNYNKANLILLDADEKRWDEIGEVSAYTELIKENIEYDALLQEYPLETETVHGILDLICETVVCRAKDITIASNVYPAELVKSKFLKLRFDHVSYVISCMQGNTTKVKNIKKYLLAALFNAPSTMDSYYRAEVNHDMPQFAREG